MDVFDLFFLEHLVIAFAYIWFHVLFKKLPNRQTLIYAIIT
jgi:hypothetical protein